MDTNLIYLFIFALVFLLAGGSILFSAGALNWMYKEGLWKVASPFSPLEDRKLRRLGGAALFFTGLTLLIMAFGLTFNLL